MSLWIAGATLAAGQIGKGMQGLAATGVDTAGAVKAAKDVSMAEKQQLDNQNKLAMDKIDFKSNTMFEAATEKGRGAMFDIFQFQEAAGRTNIAQSDATSVATKQVKEQSYSKYSTDVDKILEESELSKKGVSLASLAEQAEIEKRLQSNITAATSQADTFWEGYAGKGDYEIG